MTSLEHLSDEELLRLAEEEEVQRKITEPPYEFSRESRGVGRHLKTLYGKAKKVYHRVKDYLPSADTILTGADAVAGGGAIMTPTQGALYGASRLVRHIPKVGKHLAVPLAVAGVAPGVAKRVSAMSRGAGFLPPGFGANMMRANMLNLNAPIVNIPNASHNTSVINCSTITTSTITTNGNVAITNGGLSVAGNITTPANIDVNGILTAGSFNIQYPILIVPPTFPGNIYPTFVGGAYPCLRYSIPCSGLPTGRIVYFSISAQVQIANAGFPAFYGAGYGTIMLNSSPASKWFYRAVWNGGGGGTFPFILDDSQEIVGDIVNTFLPSITANSVNTGTTYGEGITLQFNYTYTTPVRNQGLTITWDLYGFNIVAPYTTNNLLLTTDIQMSIVG